MNENRELSKLLSELSIYYEMTGVAWKPSAYLDASLGIEEEERGVREIFETEGRPGLEKIPGVGPSIAKHIEEFLKKGRIAILERFKKKYPESLLELTHLSGVGPKKAKMLFDKLKVASIGDLDRAIKAEKIRKLGGFGAKSEENIARALERYRARSRRLLITEAEPLARELVAYLKKHGPFSKIEYLGSLRRGRETVGDIDILAVSENPAKAMEVFVSMPRVADAAAKGETKSQIILKDLGIQVDLRLVPAASWPAALNYFTGSKEHNVELRRLALDKGMTLSEYGLFAMPGEKRISLKNESELYEKLGLHHIPPELREMRGEIEASRRGELPKLIELEDIRGDLHLHTRWSDGSGTVEEMLQAAERRGYEYVAVTDHSTSMHVAHGLTALRLAEQWLEIDKVSQGRRIGVLRGAEVDILSGGSLDYPDSVLKGLDLVIGSVHSRFNLTSEEMTRRIIRAVESPFLNILGHPTGRLIGMREPYQADFERIFKAASENGVALEVSGQPTRLDLNDVHILSAKRLGAKFALDTDSHSVAGLSLMEFGVRQARRGWLTAGEVINAWPLAELKKFLNKE